ncbi:MAG: hypothetical protein MR971_01395 [Bacteroidales bacterium]|nr:hypothetical protein [Bacteroidales bacterium]
MAQTAILPYYIRVFYLEKKVHSFTDRPFTYENQLFRCEGLVFPILHICQAAGVLREGACEGLKNQPFTRFSDENQRETDGL